MSNPTIANPGPLGLSSFAKETFRPVTLPYQPHLEENYLVSYIGHIFSLTYLKFLKIVYPRVLGDNGIIPMHKTAVWISYKFELRTSNTNVLDHLISKNMTAQRTQPYECNKISTDPDDPVETDSGAKRPSTSRWEWVECGRDDATNHHFDSCNETPTCCKPSSLYSEVPSTTTQFKHNPAIATCSRHRWILSTFWSLAAPIIVIYIHLSL